MEESESGYKQDLMTRRGSTDTMAAAQTKRQVTPPSTKTPLWTSLAHGLRTATPADEFALTASDRVLMVGAHPDDETLAAGATLAAAAHVAEVYVVCLTDGEAAIAHTGVDLADLGARRRSELIGACRALGVRSVHHGGLPDGELDTLPPGIDQVLEVAANQIAPTVILTVWWTDPHPDHQAAGRGALRLAKRLGIPVAGFPIWAPHWSDPHSSVDPAKAVVISADDRSLTARKAALAQYTSQTEPLTEGLEAVLPTDLLRWTTEIAIRP